MTAQIHQDGLYVGVEPYQTAHLQCQEHQIYYELSGNPDGPTALFLHGGPGGGTSSRDRRFFNPDHYRVVLMDQRGSGRSIPNASVDFQAALENNTTDHIIEDIEQLRQALGVDHWQLILGGSWGSTLAIAYAEKHPDRCSQILLRGVFTALSDEIDALFQDGTTSNHYPEEWQNYINYIKNTSVNWELEKCNLVGAYRDRLMSPDQRLEAAKAFVGYELSISCLHGNNERVKSILADPQVLVPFAALEVHYMLHGCFLRRGQLLDHISAIKNHRIHIVHGRNDSVCLPRAAWRFFSALKSAGAGENVSLVFVAAAGHSDSDQGISDALRKATDDLFLEACR